MMASAHVTMCMFLTHWKRPSFVGLPVGGWAETEQAMLAIENALPHPSRRKWTRTEFLNAMYDTSGHHYLLRADAEDRVRQWDAAHEFIIRDGKAVRS